MTTRDTNSKAVFFAPHNDDESLFGAFTIMREKPHVVVVLKSVVQESRAQSPFATAVAREAETAAAMEIFGVTWEQWEFSDAEPDWWAITQRMSEMQAAGVERVWAPAFAEQGHEQHNAIGRKARHFWFDTASFYTTYTRVPNAKQIGENPVPYEPWMIQKKLQALACYTTQIAQEWMNPHFLRDMYEYTTNGFETRPCDKCHGSGVSSE